MFDHIYCFLQRKVLQHRILLDYEVFEEADITEKTGEKTTLVVDLRSANNRAQSSDRMEKPLLLSTGTRDPQTIGHRFCEQCREQKHLLLSAGNHEQDSRAMGNGICEERREQKQLLLSTPTSRREQWNAGATGSSRWFGRSGSVRGARAGRSAPQ